MMRFFLLPLALASCLLSGCVLDGPDVVSAYKAEERFMRVCFARIQGLALVNTLVPDASNIFPPASLCTLENKEYLKDVMYLTSAVDECERTLSVIPAANYGDFVVLYLYVKNQLCGLQPIRPGDFRKGFQWGL